MEEWASVRGATPGKKAVKRVKGRIRRILRPGNQAPWDEVQGVLNRVLRGWATYFAYGTRLMAYRAVDHYVYERVRHFLRRRHKVPSRGTERFPVEVVFGELGVFRLRRFHLAPSCACPGVKPVREPDAGKPHVRFDEQGRETAWMVEVSSSRVRRPIRGPSWDRARL